MNLEKFASCENNDNKKDVVVNEKLKVILSIITSEELKAYF